MTSKPPFEKLAVDANALLAAITGGAAFRVFKARKSFELVTTRTNIREAKRHLREHARRYEIPPSLVRGVLKDLPIRIYEDHEILSHLAEAARLLRGRKSNDAPLLALALKLDAAVWSNDPHFAKLPIDVYPTAVLLKILGV